MDNKPKPKESSDVLKQKEELEKKQSSFIADLTEEQKERYDRAMMRFRLAQAQRQVPLEEFDGMTYEQDYLYNKRAGNAFLPPKLNDDEVRVNTGTIEKKVETLMNELLAMNLQPEAIAYDHEDNELSNLGDDMIDIVRRTNEQEHDEDFDIDALRELLVQRSFFMQEQCIKKQYKSTTIYRATKDVISGLRVYLGDIQIPARLFQTQPYICLYTRRDYDVARTIYKDWERWEYVKPGNSISSADNPLNYRANTITDNEVEEIHVIDPINNEYEIIINGVPMCVEPNECPWEITPDRAYNITQVIIKPMDTDFAYGKQPVSSAKFLQGFKDETIRLLIRKFRQAIEPPLASKKRIVSKDLWSPGTVAYGVKKDDFERLIDHDGVTSSEYAMYNLIETKTEEFIGAGTLGQPTSQGPEKTATQNQQEQINSIKNLGLIVLAFMRIKREATYQRIYNIIENFTEPQKRLYDPYQEKLSNVYQKFTVNNSMFGNGKKGKKIIQFTESPLTQEEKENIYAYEQKEAAAGRPVRIRAINVKLLNEIILFWKVVINSQPRDGSELQKVLYKDKLTQGIGIEQASQGQKRVNWERAADDFERTWQTKDFFQKEAPQQQPTNQQQNPTQEKAQNLLNDITNFERTEAGSQMTEFARRPNQAPSVNRLEDNVQ